MVKHLNVKGKLSDEPCNPKYKVVPLRTPTFLEKHMPQQTHTLQILGKGVKSDTKTGQMSRKYNSWTTCDSVSLDTLQREAHALRKEKVRRRRAMSVPGSSPVVLSPGDRDIVKTADIPASSVRAASDTLEDVETDDPPPVSMISTSFVLSSPTPTVSLGLVASSIVVPFLSSPFSSSPPLIVPLEPGCNLHEEELAEEALTIEKLQQYFPALRQDIETLPPDIVSDTQASPPSAVIMHKLLLLKPLFHSSQTRFCSHQSLMNVFVPHPLW